MSPEQQENESNIPSLVYMNDSDILNSEKHEERGSLQ